jgi:hypothetical protein
MTLEDQIFQAIKTVMPNNADIHIVSRIKALKINVSWPLNDDSERPNKTSKTILICVSHEAAQDFSNVNQGAAYNRVLEYLQGRLAQFDPQHNAPKSEMSPVEEWVITSKIMLG